MNQQAPIYSNDSSGGGSNIRLEALKQKRLRHLTSLNAKNLKINATRFNVWFTLHLNAACKAFFISEKKEHDRSPKWTLKDSLNKYSFKQFVIRIWYSNLEDLSALTKTKTSAKQPSNNSQQQTKPSSRLNLLLEIDVHMDFLTALNDTNLQTVTKSVKSYPNFLVFEVFAQNFAEPFVEALSSKKRNNTLSAAKHQQTLQLQQQPSTLAKISAKKSYTLNSMIRLQDFQRVIQETQLKIVQLKTNSLNKFEQLARLRQLHLKRDECLLRIGIYRDSLNKLEQSIMKLVQGNSEAEERKIALADKLETFDTKVYQVERKRYFQIEKIFIFTTKALGLIQAQLKWRQKDLIVGLADIFHIESFTKSQHLDMLTSLPLNYKQQQQQQQQPGKLKLLNTSLVINRGIVYTNSKNAGTMTEVADDEENAIALGYVVHVAQLLADILCVPLKYPLLFRSSRSYVIEQLNDFDSRKLPLFKNTASDDVFFYAVGLLNIDLTQLKVFVDKRFLGIMEPANSMDLLLNLKSIFEYFKRVSSSKQ
jgi:hypothetical protein